MPKTSVPGLDRIGDLFTSAELAVLESSAGKQLLAASQKQLDKAIVQARSLRDKWRDLLAKQSRTTKRSSAAISAANTRSQEKSDAFAAAIERIQARLAEIGLVPGATRPRAPKPERKAARAAGHRAERAEVRSKLAEAKVEINRSRAQKTAAKIAAAPASPSAKPAAVTTKKKRGKKQRLAVALQSLTAKAANQPLRFDVAKQRSAKASATAARLKLDGKVTRRSGHTLAAGKRRQATRDARRR